jgi:hypothetical protein
MYLYTVNRSFAKAFHLFKKNERFENHEYRLEVDERDERDEQSQIRIIVSLHTFVFVYPYPVNLSFKKIDD